MKKLYIILSVAFVLVLIMLLLVTGWNSGSKNRKDAEIEEQNLQEAIVNTKKIKGRHQLKLETNKEMIRQIIMKRKKEEQQKSDKEEVFDRKPAEKE